MQFTEEQLLQVKEMNHWSDDDLERFKEFIETYHEYIPEEWTLEDLACAVAIFENADQAFWFMEDGQDFADLTELLVTYDLTRVSSSQTTLSQHLVEEHEHYFKVKNGYVFFAG